MSFDKLRFRNGAGAGWIDAAAGRSGPSPEVADG